MSYKRSKYNTNTAYKKSKDKCVSKELVPTTINVELDICCLINNLNAGATCDSKLLIGCGDKCVKFWKTFKSKLYWGINDADLRVFVCDHFIPWFRLHGNDVEISDEFEFGDW